MSRYISFLYLEAIGMSQNHLTFFQLDNKQNQCLEIIHITCFDFHLSTECRLPSMHVCTKKMQMVDTSNTAVQQSDMLQKALQLAMAGERRSSEKVDQIWSSTIKGIGNQYRKALKLFGLSSRSLLCFRVVMKELKVLSNLLFFLNGAHSKKYFPQKYS